MARLRRTTGRGSNAQHGVRLGDRGDRRRSHAGGDHGLELYGRAGASPPAAQDAQALVDRGAVPTFSICSASNTSSPSSLIRASRRES